MADALKKTAKLRCLSGYRYPRQRSFRLSLSTPLQRKYLSLRHLFAKYYRAPVQADAFLTET